MATLTNLLVELAGKSVTYSLSFDSKSQALGTITLTNSGRRDVTLVLTLTDGPHAFIAVAGQTSTYTVTGAHTLADLQSWSFG